MKEHYSPVRNHTTCAISQVFYCGLDNDFLEKETKEGFSSRYLRRVRAVEINYGGELNSVSPKRHYLKREHFFMEQRK